MATQVCGQKHAWSMKWGKKQQGQYNAPSKTLFGGLSSYALGERRDRKLELVDEPVYDSELPDSALGPLR
jgi:hypothetical protein